MHLGLLLGVWRVGLGFVWRIIWNSRLFRVSYWMCLNKSWHYLWQGLFSNDKNAHMSSSEIWELLKNLFTMEIFPRCLDVEFKCESGVKLQYFNIAIF